jgi:hypothetical protein
LLSYFRPEPIYKIFHLEATHGGRDVHERGGSQSRWSLLPPSNPHLAKGAWCWLVMRQSAHGGSDWDYDRHYCSAKQKEYCQQFCNRGTRPAAWRHEERLRKTRITAARNAALWRYGSVTVVERNALWHHPSPRSKVQQPPCAPCLSRRPSLRANLVSFKVLPIRKPCKYLDGYPKGITSGRLARGSECNRLLVLKK